MNTDGNFMVCLMLAYFNKENKLQQRNFILYSMCCSTEIKVAI